MTPINHHSTPLPRQLADTTINHCHDLTISGLFKVYLTAFILSLGTFTSGGITHFVCKHEDCSPNTRAVGLITLFVGGIMTTLITILSIAAIEQVRYERRIQQRALNPSQP